MSFSKEFQSYTAFQTGSYFVAVVPAVYNFEVVDDFAEVISN